MGLNGPQDTAPRIVATHDMPWDVGRAAVGLAAGTGADGETSSAGEGRYETKTFHHDPATGERGFLARAPSGHAISHRYHHSAEESLVLGGALDLRSDGVFTRGCYFWRPPGWVHASNRTDYWEAITFSVGRDAREGSGAHSDVLCSPDEEGSNPLHEERELAVGPRGWVRHLDTTLMPWQGGAQFSRSEASMMAMRLDLVAVKVLSRNVDTGACTVLFRIGRGGVLAADQPLSHDLKLFVLEGDLSVSGVPMTTGAFFHAPPSTVIGDGVSAEGALVLLKTDAWLDLPRLSTGNS